MLLGPGGRGPVQRLPPIHTSATGRLNPPIIQLCTGLSWRSHMQLGEQNGG
jgi:hypothetical protein